MDNNQPQEPAQPQNIRYNIPIPSNRLRDQPQPVQPQDIHYNIPIPKDRKNGAANAPQQLPITPPYGIPKDAILPRPTPRLQQASVIIAEQLSGSHTRPREVQLTSFALYTGELSCITGGYNNGTTTLLNLLALEETATAGTLTIHNRETVSLGDKERHAWQQAHIVSIRHSHIEHIYIEPTQQKGHDFVAYWLHYYEDTQWKVAQERAWEALDAVNISHGRGSTAIHNLSAYEQACLSIAKVIVPGKRSHTIYLFDDLFASLNETEATHIITYLRRLARQGKTVVTLMHHQNMKLVSLFDHVLTMHNNTLTESYNQHP